MPNPNDDAASITAAILTHAIHTGSRDPIIASLEVIKTFEQMRKLVEETASKQGGGA